MTPEDALQLLRRLDAPPHLILHHELVLEAARALCAGLVRAFPVLEISVPEILAGAALHDVGKIVFPEEMHGPGHAHEAAGRQLLLAQGVPAPLAAICVDHARWRAPDLQLESLLVALCDKLWKGRRETELEDRVRDRLGDRLEVDAWQLWIALDDLCESIARDGPARLLRSGAGGPSVSSAG